MTIKQAREKLKDIFQAILKSDDRNVHVLKVATGLGKTELCTELRNVLLALPNHSLKDEVCKRMKVEYRPTPSLNSLPADVRKRLEYLYSIGANFEANRYLAEKAKVDNSCQEYLKDCHVCYLSNETIITTHQRALFIDWLHETIIFDEDVVTSLLPTGKVTISDLIRLEANLNNEHDQRTISHLINEIRQGRVNTPRKMESIIFKDFQSIEYEVLSSNVKYNSNILHFFESDFFVVDANDVATIHYIRKYELPESKKIIILSATANEEIYRNLVGDRLRFYDISNVEPVGIIEQNTKYSCSKSSLAKHIDYILEQVKDMPVITFAEYKDLFSNPIEDMHYGKTTGFDILKGKDIAVVGTPHVSPITIALYASILKISIRSHDYVQQGYYPIRQQQVISNGFRFWFNAYDNEELRNLQFYFIESELKQAVGRPRVNTEPVSVKLYSNYPLPEACINDEEIQIGRQKLERNKASLAISNKSDSYFEKLLFEDLNLEILHNDELGNMKLNVFLYSALFAGTGTMMTMMQIIKGASKN
ncbi:hypothetical protein [Nostoc sp. 106C]|uniref:hypothetical protein n=1 Tax=Nostoc sp. 106C TaxID=1932667 RepID=UPI000A371C01|nr:hypothetical protein [Nostoc sp. 106C]OUL17829.1 hypothetical protein BV375_34920 [Nostoc sp. 106C]